MEPAAPAPVTGESNGTRWSVMNGTPHPALAGLASRYSDYAEHSALPLQRRQVAHPGVTVILSYGDPILLSVEGRARPYTSFVAGIHDQCVITEYCGGQAGMQVDLTPLGARRLLGLPMHHLANERAATDALESALDLVDLTDRLAHAAGPLERFALLDATLLAAAETGPVVRAETAWAWQELRRTGGLVSVSDLAAEVGWSRRHLIRCFGEEIGLPPKPVARLLRFSRAVELLDTVARPSTGPIATISDVAATTGYADHSHLVREFRRLAGCSPSTYLADVSGDGLGVVVDAPTVYG